MKTKTFENILNPKAKPSYPDVKAILINIYLQLIIKLRQMLTAKNSIQTLLHTVKYNKICYNNGNPYNLRWQFKWRHSYYTYPKDTFEHVKVKKPEDTPESTPLFWTVYQDVLMRFVPQIKVWIARSSRIQDKFQLLFLPGFKILAFIPMGIFYTRLRDKCIDPDVKQMWLRDMVHRNPQLGKLFKPETIHVLDHDIEWDQGYPCQQKFPEFKNKFWRFFNSDTSMTTGYFKFGDLESGATMNFKFKTMPTHGQFRYQVGEPFYYYDVRVELNHNGEYKEIVLIDENQELKKKRPFLLLI